MLRGSYGLPNSYEPELQMSTMHIKNCSIAVCVFDRDKDQSVSNARPRNPQKHGVWRVKSIMWNSGEKFSQREKMDSQCMWVGTVDTAQFYVYVSGILPPVSKIVQCQTCTVIYNGPGK